MKKRKSARRGRQPYSNPRYTGSWAIVLIDGAPIRDRALREYHKAEKGVLSVRSQVEVFETQDLPAFGRWEARVFGQMMTDLRSVQAQADEKRRIVEAIDEEMFWSNCSRLDAYRAVMHRMANPSAHDEEDDAEEDFADDQGEDNGGEKMFGESDLPPDFDINEFDRLKPNQQRKFRQFYESMGMMYEAFTGNPAPDLDEVLRRERGGKPGPNDSHDAHRARQARPVHHPKPAPRDPTEDRLKSLYRTLARQLHPDANPDQGLRERELWHEVQAAYHARDVERLEAAAGRVEIGLNGSSTSLPVGILLRMTRDLNGVLRGLRGRVRKLRAHPAWGFSSLGDKLQSVESSHRARLVAERERAEDELSALTDLLDALAARSARGGQRRKKRTPPRDGQAQMAFF